eukprot:13234692-Alexandrium_andersonii.AAC.1
MRFSKQTRRGPPAHFPGLEPKWPRGRPDRAQGRASNSPTPQTHLHCQTDHKCSAPTSKTALHTHP